MKKHLIIALFSFVLFFSSASAAFTAGINSCDNPSDPLGVGCGAQSGLSTVDIRITVARVISSLLQVLGIIALVLVLYSGFNWMTAGGEEDKIEKAKDTLKAAVIGLIIILSGYALTQFILFQIYSATTNSATYGGGAGADYACEDKAAQPPPPTCNSVVCSSALRPDVCQQGTFQSCCDWKQR